MIIKDKVQQWRITIEGLDEHMKTIVGGRAAITKEALECLKGSEEEIGSMEFNILWRAVMHKSMEELK